MNTIVVTGGAGFLGRNLCKKLLENPNNQIICIDNLITGNIDNISEFTQNPNFLFINKDVTHILELPINKIHEIYHLACIASPDKYKQYSIETLVTCFEGTKNVLELCRKHKSKLLFTSTSEIYGDPLIHPQPEEYFGNVNTIGERSCYDEGKRVAETLMYEYRRRHQLDLKLVRLFNTYGPYMDLNDGRVITNFIHKIMKKEPLQIYGDGSQTRSFCYVDDLIEGLVAMMASTQQGPINLGNPYCEFTLNELIKVFEDIIGQPLAVEYLNATENDPKQRKPVIDKAMNLLSFNPKIELREGLKKTFDYFTVRGWNPRGKADPTLLRLEGVNEVGGSVVWYCYILRNTKPEYKNLTYNGSTNDPKRRLRQHNGEIKGGANFTSKTKGGWEIYCLMSGFPDHVNALQCEWRFKHCTGKPGTRPKCYCGVAGRIKGLNEVLPLENWTSKSTIDNKTQQFKLYIMEDVADHLDRSIIPSNIEIHKGIPNL